MNEETKKMTDTGSFACTNCGAELKFKPGTDYLNCDYCGTRNEIPQVDGQVEELDFYAYLEKKSIETEKISESFVKCNSCGASSTLEPNIVSAKCPYCSTPLVLEQAHDESIIQPKSLLPFKLDKNEAKESFKKWLNKLWFLPGDMKKASLNLDQFKGIYIPYWTYDTDTLSFYTGQRGDYYYESQTYTTNEGGKTVTKTRQVRKTRWNTVQGTITKAFNDLLIAATRSLPVNYLNQLEPWDLENLMPFEKSYLSGFITEMYQVGLGEGFEIAKRVADEEIRQLVRRDIGGDEQHITLLKTNYSNITFKHLLLPVFVSAYKFKGKLYQFLVNGRTGEVQGLRPYSWIKIAAMVLLIILIVAIIVMLSGGS